MDGMIGTGPHKGSHTAVALGAAEEPLGTLRVRACPDQAQKLTAWAQAWPERTWAVEGARGLGGLLAQQLVAAGERVLDVQPKLAARVRLLATERLVMALSLGAECDRRVRPGSMSLVGLDGYDAHHRRAEVAVRVL